MTVNLDHWVRKWFAKVAAAAAAVILLNAGAYVFGVARLGVLAANEGEAAKREGEALQERESLARATAGQVDRFRDGKRALDTLATDHLKTRSERLTQAQEAVESIARAAGLTMGGIGYGYEELPGATKKVRWSRGYVEVQLRFIVTGSYPQHKKFLADLQASPQFFVVGPPSFSTSGQGAVLLNMTLTTSTYFVAGDPPPDAAPEAGAPGAAQEGQAAPGATL